MGKLFHIDLNDQMPGRYDQDLRFGSSNIKACFWLVKFLEDVGYSGPRHFDAHAYRTEDYEGVKDFARGCMPVNGNRHFEGRLEHFESGRLTLDLSEARRKHRPAEGAPRKLELELANVEKANLVPEL